jgi:hypothetical protein
MSNDDLVSGDSVGANDNADWLADLYEDFLRAILDARSVNRELTDNQIREVLESALDGFEPDPDDDVEGLLSRFRGALEHE